MKVYGISVSYFTGKIELYLRYKGIEYEMLSPFSHANTLRTEAKAVQIPVLLRPDGRWMSDTTPMILQLEDEYPERPVFERPLPQSAGYWHG